MADHYHSPSQPLNLVTQLHFGDELDRGRSHPATPTSSGRNTPVGGRSSHPPYLAASHRPDPLSPQNITKKVASEQMSADSFARMQAAQFARSILAPAPTAPSQDGFEATKQAQQKLLETIEQRAKQELRFTSEEDKWQYALKHEEEDRLARARKLAEAEENHLKWREAMDQHVKDQRSEISHEFCRINLAFPSALQLLPGSANSVEVPFHFFCRSVFSSLPPTAGMEAEVLFGHERMQSTIGRRN